MRFNLCFSLLQDDFHTMVRVSKKRLDTAASHAETLFFMATEIQFVSFYNLTI